MRRVLIFGYYGFRNTGDEAILTVLLQDLSRESAGVEAVVVSGDPGATSRDHAVEAIRFTDLPALIDAARQCDAVVLGGGGLFHDYWGAEPDRALSSDHGSLSFVMAAPLLAAVYGKPLLIYAVGVGPLATEEGRRMTRAAFGCADFATVRDEVSKATLDAIGVDTTGVVVAADPAFALEPAPAPEAEAILRGEGVAPGGVTVGVALRDWNVGVSPERWEAAVAGGLDLFLVRHPEAKILCLPFQDMEGELVDDRAVARRIAAKMAQGSRVVRLPSALGPAQTAALVSRCDVILAMRLHAAIFAVAAQVPVVALAYDPKVAGFLDEVGLAELTLGLAGLAPSTVCARLDHALAERERLRPRLAAAAPELGRRARHGATLAGARLAAPRPVRPIGPDLAWVLGRAAVALSRRAFELAEDGERVRRELGEGIAFLRRQAAGLEESLAVVREQSAQRDAHLQAALAEIRRWETSRLGRLRDRLDRWRGIPGRARAALGRASAPGTRLHDAGSRFVPEPVARWLRRVAPIATSSGLVPAPMPRERPTVEGLSPEPAGRYDVVVLSIIDWSFRFQRPQQIATQFGRRGHRVLYLSTTQFLEPGGRAWDLTRRAEGVAELRIRARRPLDIYGGRLDADDVAVLAEAFEALARDLAMGDAICLVQIPFWGPLAVRLRERLGWRVIYDCMDEWTNFPGFGPDVLALEEGLVRRADLTVVSADRLLGKWRATARRLVVAKNGVDVEHYRRLYGPATLLPGARRPVIGYYGALASWVDVPLLAKIADRHPDATIALAGGHFDVDLTSIASRPNVRLLGQRPYEQMPGLLWNFDVCIIPFLVNDITEATNPVKFYEYLYGGKPVVAPALTELEPYAGLAYLARDHEEFLRQIDAALAEEQDDSRRAERRRVAEENDWSKRYEAVDSGIREAHPLVSVVIVSFGARKLTEDCLASLLERETWPRLEVVVVDNGSDFGSVEFLDGVAARDGRLRCVYNRENRGFAAANNQGIAAARGEVVVLLNNDTVVPPGLLGRLVAHLERDPTIGLLCPTTNFCGNEALVEPDYREISGLSAYAARRAGDFRGRVFDIPVAAMYCVAARRDVLERVGPLDEAYGIGMFEDDDLAVRMRGAGLRVCCAEDAYVHHVGQGAFRKFTREEYDSLWKRNQAYFEKKFGVAWKPHAPRKGVAPVASRVGEPPADSGAQP